MYQYALDELVWAAAREREEGARRTRPYTEDHPRIAPSVIAVTVSPANCC